MSKVEIEEYEEPEENTEIDELCVQLDSVAKISEETYCDRMKNLFVAEFDKFSDEMVQMLDTMYTYPGPHPLYEIYSDKIVLYNRLSALTVKKGDDIILLFSAFSNQLTSIYYPVHTHGTNMDGKTIDAIGKLTDNVDFEFRFRIICDHKRAGCIEFYPVVPQYSPDRMVDVEVSDVFITAFRKAFGPIILEVGSQGLMASTQPDHNEAEEAPTAPVDAMTVELPDYDDNEEEPTESAVVIADQYMSIALRKPSVANSPVNTAVTFVSTGPYSPDNLGFPEEDTWPMSVDRTRAVFESNTKFVEACRSLGVEVCYTSV